jgi:hypothetical protein
MKVYFDLDAEDPYHRIEWERMLGEASAHNSPACAIVEDRQASDVVILSREPPFSLLEKMSPLSPGDVSTLVWDHSDHPVGRMKGFYCSLPRPAFDPRRHRTYCYPIVYNELIESFPLADAAYDYGFMGGITAPLRQKILRHLSADADLKGLIKVQGGPWDRMFDRSGVAAKVEYADNVRSSKFVICPRGNGVGSVRLFEVMKAGRVPVIVSDSYVPPSGVDWTSCSIRVKEDNVHNLTTLISQNLPDWQVLSANARRSWEAFFSAGALTGQLRRMIDGVSDHGRGPAPAAQLRYVSGQLRAASGRALRRVARRIR